MNQEQDLQELTPWPDAWPDGFQSTYPSPESGLGRDRTDMNANGLVGFNPMASMSFQWESLPTDTDFPWLQPLEMESAPLEVSVDLDTETIPASWTVFPPGHPSNTLRWDDFTSDAFNDPLPVDPNLFQQFLVGLNQQHHRSDEAQNAN